MDINRSMMKSCSESHQMYELELSNKRKQELEEETASKLAKLAADQEVEKTAYSEEISRTKNAIESDILLIKSGIDIAELSVSEGNKALENCLKSSSLDRKKLTSAQFKISMGVKRKRASAGIRCVV